MTVGRWLLGDDGLFVWVREGDGGAEAEFSRWLLAAGAGLCGSAHLCLILHRPYRGGVDLLPPIFQAGTAQEQDPRYRYAKHEGKIRGRRSLRSVGQRREGKFEEVAPLMLGGPIAIG